VTILFSCSNVFENSNTTDFTVSLDLSQLIKNQNKTQARNASKNTGTLTLTLYNTLDNSVNQIKEFSKENLSVISSVAVEVNSDGITRVSFLNIPIGIKAVIFAECSIPNSDNSEVLYEGCSQVFEVTSGKNFVKIDLSKIIAEEKPDDDDEESTEDKDEGNSDENNSDSETDETTPPTNEEDAAEGNDSAEEDTKEENDPAEGNDSETNNYTIEISFPEYSDYLKLQKIEDSNKVSVVVTEDGIEIESYSWFVDGVKKDDNTANFDLGNFPLGQYTVMVVCVDSKGKTYSATMQVIVQNF